MSEIYMQTGEMASYQAGSMQAQQPWTKITSRMAEGQQFATKDAAASKAFEKYGHDANLGLKEYTNKARDNRLDYVNTEQENAMLLERIDFSRAPERQ